MVVTIAILLGLNMCTSFNFIVFDPIAMKLASDISINESLLRRRINEQAVLAALRVDFLFVLISKTVWVAIAVNITAAAW